MRPIHTQFFFALIPTRVTAVIASSALVLLTGCASAPLGYRELGSANQLQLTTNSNAPLQFKNPDASFARYSKIMIDPVKVYAGSDAQFGDVKQEDRASIGKYMQDEFFNTLEKRFQIARVPGSDTLRVRLTLTGIETSTPVLSTVTHITPVGLVLNAGLAATSKKGTFSGSVSYAVELSDSATGALLNAYVTNQSANALNVVASFASLDAARGGVRAGARQLSDKLAGLGMRRGPERVVAPRSRGTEAHAVED